MDKNKILSNLKKSTMCLVIPVLMVACSKNNNGNTAAELANVETELTKIEDKLNQMQAETDTLVKDSLSRDARCIELVDQLKRHREELGRLSAPKDSVRAKRVSRKLGSIWMDSMMNANKVKEQIVAMRKNEFNKIYKEQNRLRSKRDSLMKIKSR